MSEKSNISWTDSTWNSWIGCRSVSPGCQNCYARMLVNGRMAGDFSKRLRTSPTTFNAPLRWNKKPLACSECGGSFPKSESEGAFSRCPVCWQNGIDISLHRRRVFLGSLMDWLDPEVPIEWLADSLDIIRRCPDLIFQTVTKRPELFRLRILDALAHVEKIGECEDWPDRDPETDIGDWLNEWECGQQIPKNVWVITSVEDQKRANDRIPELLKIPAVVHGLSVEPLLEPVNLWGHYGTRLNRVDWVIAGLESGPNRRDPGVAAIEDIARQCRVANVPCFVKQDCAARPGKQGRISDEVWNLKQFPA